MENTNVRDRRMAALWYAWGMLDASSEYGENIPQDFADFCAKEAAAYYSPEQTSSFLGSIMDQLGRYSEALRLLDPRKV